MKRWIAPWAAAALGAGLLSAQAAQLTISAGSELTLRADHEPLARILALLAQQGVTVRFDPRIDTTVTADFRRLDMEKALRRIVSPNDFVLVWDVVSGPLGPLPRISEVQVFRPGEPGGASPLPAPPAPARTVAATNRVVLVVPGEVLVRVKPGTTAAAFRALLGRTGTTVVDCFEPGAVYLLRTAPDTDLAALLAQLRKSDLVARAEPNYVYRLVPPSPSEAGSASARTASASTEKRGAAVAVLDSGLDPRANLGSALLTSWDATQPDRSMADPVGHGTHMALIASGLVNPEGAAAGEPASVIAIRAFDDEGYASNFGLLRAVTYAANNGARVINMSWESNAESAFLADALAYAANKDIVLVAAAGNTPSGTPVYPAALPGVLAVSALNPDGTVWENSNYGGFVALSAPGVAVLPSADGKTSGWYAGTSIASAYVARTLADYFADHPKATSRDAVTALIASLTDSGEKGADVHFGAGALDAEAVKRLTAK